MLGCELTSARDANSQPDTRDEFASTTDVKVVTRRRRSRITASRPSSSPKAAPEPHRPHVHLPHCKQFVPPHRR
jgi:hypothetical protein